jgi:flagellar hook protein FlgE
VQGWTAQNGQIVGGQAIGDITLPVGEIVPAVATTRASAKGNLPAETAVGEQLIRDIEVYAADGSSSSLRLTFTRTAGDGWDVTDGTNTASLAFADGVQTGGPVSLPTAGGITVDLSTLTGFSDVSSLALTGQDGRPAGTLTSYALTEDGSLMGAFSNGESKVLARLSLAGFTNPEGLEKVGSSQFRPTGNSGAAAVGQAGQDGIGAIVSGALEMSNVDLSQEFTNLIVAQRGFQANARIITTSDEVLQELTNLKR